MYKKSGFVKKFESIECTISWKSNGKLCTLDVQKVQIHEKIQIHWMYEIVKIQWKFMYIRGILDIQIVRICGKIRTC